MALCHVWRCLHDTKNKKCKAPNLDQPKNQGYLLHVIFDDGKDCIYDVNDDINTIEEYKDLKTICGLFEQVQLDESRTCVFWNDFIDLPSDAIYENSAVPHEAIDWD